MRATSKDIARLAEVSQSAVSRVLNNAPIRISEEKKERIIKIARELNYFPNKSAQALKRGRSNDIAIVIYDFGDPWAGGYMSLLDLKLEHTDYKAVWLGCYSAHHAERSPVDFLFDISKSVDGIVIVHSSRYLKDSDIINFWSKTNMPLLTVLREIPGGEIPSITINNRLGTELLFNHLRELGHERIGFCYCEKENVTAIDRFISFKELLMQSGLPYDPELYLEVGGTVKDGYKAGKYFCSLKNPPTAVIAYKDLIAMGFLKAARDSGISVPEQMSLCAYDDLPLAPYTIPSLTTAATNFDELTDRTIKDILELIEEKLEGDSKESELVIDRFIHQPRLIARKSTGPAVK